MPGAYSSVDQQPSPAAASEKSQNRSSNLPQHIVSSPARMSSFVIKHYPDEQLQQRINGYYAAFAAQDVERLMEFIGDEFHMDDYGESTHTSLC